MIVYPGLHRIQTLTCTPAEARPILRAFLEEHPDKVDHLAQTFRGMSMKVIRRNDLPENDLRDWFSVTKVAQAQVRDSHPLLGAKLDMLADLLYDRWLIWQRDRWRRGGRIGTVETVMTAPDTLIPETEGGPAAAGHEGA
ncbi:hypothetical protein KABACHOK_01280 [Brevundimonas phage vB_BpoS-Kabachok]|uniref:Uncharacterized protein n=1 Tax=Brevundimonas phage vB_BpoS-Kabachok TaxID=2948600 RepID=A0A9E7MPG8_9CAUD|nr:hypothetical protein KABACHOK_01280 [Brevundimonas phage vB_BpoS-Kabachok]